MVDERGFPDFVVIGAMKAGTTALHAYLSGQRSVFMASPKELDFFTEHGNWHRGFDWYRERFEEARPDQVAGEVSPNYSKRHLDRGTAQRLVDTLPAVRLVYCVRHPIARIESMYAHLAATGVETRPIDRAVLEDDDYVLTSSYAHQLEPYLERMTQDRILVVLAHELRNRRRATVGRVLEFVGVTDPVDETTLSGEPNRAEARRIARGPLPGLGRIPGYRRLLNRSWRLRRIHDRIVTRPAPVIDTTLDPATESELRRRLSPDVRALRSLLEPSFDGWGIA